MNPDGSGQRQLTSLSLAKAGNASKGFVVQNKGKAVEQAKPAPRKEKPAPRKEQTAQLPKLAQAVPPPPAPRKSRLIEKAKDLAPATGGVVLLVLLTWTLMRRRRV